MLTEELAQIVLLFCCFCFELRLLDGPRGLVCHLMLMVFPASQISAAKRDYTVLSQKPCQTLLKQKKKKKSERHNTKTFYQWIQPFAYWYHRVQPFADSWAQSYTRPLIQRDIPTHFQWRGRPLNLNLPRPSLSAAGRMNLTHNDNMFALFNSSHTSFPSLMATLQMKIKRESRGANRGNLEKNVRGWGTPLSSPALPAGASLAAIATYCERGTVWHDTGLSLPIIKPKLLFLWSALKLQRWFPIMQFHVIYRHQHRRAHARGEGRYYDW